MLAFIRYIEVYFTFAFLNCVRYNEDFVKSRFCSIHFTVILAWLKKIFCYAEDFVIQNRLVRRPATPVTVLRAARYRSISRSLFHILPGEVHPKKHLNIAGSQKNVFLKFPTTWIFLIGLCFGLNQVQPYCTCRGKWFFPDLFTKWHTLAQMCKHHSSVISTPMWLS